jgi:hypothetical protein
MSVVAFLIDVLYVRQKDDLSCLFAVLFELECPKVFIKISERISSFKSALIHMISPLTSTAPLEKHCTIFEILIN